MARVIVILLIVLTIVSCKKTDNTTSPITPAPTLTTYDLSWTMLLMPGIPSYANLYQFSFATTAPTTSTTVWDFGDGSTSLAFAPTHVYSAVSSYNVTLIINGDTTHFLRKILNVAVFLPHSFWWSGVPLTDSSLIFHSNVLPDSAFLWDFGDGTTSTDSVPIHVFHSLGTYNVKLTINGNVATSVTEPVTIINDPIYTHLIVGTRLWHDTAYLFSSKPSTTVYPRPNISFSLTYINATQIAYGSRLLNFIPGSSNDSMLRFGSGYTDNTGDDHDISVSFYHFTNRVQMSQYDRISAGGATSETWTSP